MSTFVTQADPDYSLLNEHTGEVIEWRRTKVVSIDEFIMFFFASMPELFKLKGLQLKVLMCCWKHSSYGAVETEGNIVNNNKLLKEYIRSCGLDITDGAAVEKTISDLQPDGVVHCAAWTAVDAAEDADKQAKVWAVNVTGTENIAQACRQADCKLIYLSTDYVFSGEGDEPWQPDCQAYAPLSSSCASSAEL